MSPLCKVGTENSVQDIAAALSCAIFADIARTIKTTTPAAAITFEEDGLRNKWMCLEHNPTQDLRIQLRVVFIANEFWIYSVASDIQVLAARARTAERVLDLLQSHLNGPATPAR